MLTFIIIICFGFMIMCIYAGFDVLADRKVDSLKIQNECRNYNAIKDFIIFKYIGGIKNISINSNVTIKLFKEGISFTYLSGTERRNYMIHSNEIEDISIQTQQSIQEKVSVGKLLVFGILAFGLKGKQKELNKEYLVLNVNKNNENFNVILDCRNIQNGLESLLKLK
ncbi:hypothetical protein DVV91_16745 [Clostridium botulinum]|uniref:hypothetical protein n=1 Tax=Clostridium botulinum TaxID=1491 RepID=UPI0019671C42|nr:hypothetical protein [Clostridium botulinum]MBN1075971.1 hypothetical protein [Clostridium botulinum]